MKIKIDNKFIGPRYPCFIIAEAGVNHNGDLKLAKKLVDVASNAKADAVKFQTFNTEDLVTKNLELASYQEQNIGIKDTQYNMLKKLELSLDDFFKLKDYCDKKEIIFLSTLHTNGNILDTMAKILPAFKVASGDINNLSFLEKIAKKKKPIILGTGMSTLEEVIDAKNTIESNNNNQIIMLHATSNYPCPLEEVNLNAMKTMQTQLDCLVGYSDHTKGILVPLLAVALGAVVLEKHLTLDNSLPGPDHKASLNPSEFKKMVIQIRIVEKALGYYDKKPVKSEIEIKKFARKSIVAKTSIKKDVIINEDMLIIKRPGTGINPNKLYSIIGKKAKRNISEDQILSEDMFE